MIKAVIFDMDGVLIDSEPANLKIIQDFFAAHGKTAEDDYLHSLVGRSIHDTWHLTSAAWKDPISFDAYCELYEQYRKEHPIHYPEILFPEVKEILLWLKNEGYQIAVASSSKLRTIKRVMGQCELEDMFDLYMSGEMFEKSKPDPEIYIKTAQKLGLSVQECIAVEDSKAGIASCLAAHMKVIARIDLRFGADPEKADYQVNNLIEIKEILMKEKQA